MKIISHRHHVGANAVSHLSATIGYMGMSYIPNDSSQLALSYETIRQRIGPYLPPN